MKKLNFFVLFFIISFSVYSQSKRDSIMYLWGAVPIYEYGTPLKSCETNFENLFKNWNPVNVTNAHEYELLDFKFIETITDTIRYNYYRNYFSSGDAFGNSGTTNSSEKGKFKTLSGKTVIERTKISECFVRPTFINREIFDQRGLSAEAKKILTEEFTRQARELLMREMNIDTMKLIHTAGEIFKTRKFKSPSVFGDLDVGSKRGTKYNLVSTDSISRILFDFLVKGEANYEGLSIQEIRAFTLEQILVYRISTQLAFNRSVHFGDKVYVVRFRYYGATYPVYVICNPDTKKVVMDFFFKNIYINIK